LHPDRAHVDPRPAHADPPPAHAGTDVPWFLRTRARIFVTLLAVLAIPFGIFNFDVAARARRTVLDRQFAMNSAVARLGADAVDAHFEGLLTYVEGFARRSELAEAVAGAREQDIRDLLRELVQRNPSLNRAFVSDPAGVERYDWPPDDSVIGMDFSHRDWYRGVREKQEAYVSEIYERAAAPKCDVVALAVPIGRAPDEVRGYLVAQYTIDSLANRLERIMAREARTLTVFDRNGRPALPVSDLAVDLRELQNDGVLKTLLERPDEPSLADDPLTRKPSLLSAARVQRIGWTVLASLPDEVMYEPVADFRSSLLVAAGICLLGMLALGFVWLNVVRRHHLAVLDLQRQKDLLSGMVLHDLRNPLAVTMGSLDLARAHADDLDPKIRDDLTRAARSARRARELLNTLLDIMRMEEGALSLNLETIDLGALVRGKVDEFQPLAKATSIALTANLPEAAIEASLDAGLIGRVLDNLVTNAVKHTPPGGKVEVRVEPDPGERRVALSVSDTGEGIPEDAIPLLFQKFAPVVGQQMRRPHDAGLGLVFCRMTVERHGGTIEARSERGKGSVFRVLLPLAAA
jgi:signal transduction histidine kinase